MSSFVKPSRVRESSVPISADWTLLEEIEFNRLSKLRLDVEQPENMYVLSHYSIDRL
jgi:translation initiation factor 3 subunit D